MTAATHAVPAASRGRDHVAATVHAIEPILNRAVLVGPPVIEFLINDPAMRAPRLAYSADSTLCFATTSMLDRLRPELQKLGGTQTARSADTDRWSMPSGVSLDLTQVSADDDPSQLWLEYATLLTLPLQVGSDATVRIAGAAAMLALECDNYARSGVRAAESEEMERALLLIAGRREVEKELTAAPPELRVFVAATLAGLARADVTDILLQRALPDAALIPALARGARERVTRLAA